MPAYAWICHKCHGTNDMGASSCEHCGFPATASGIEIEAAIAGEDAAPSQDKRSFLAARKEELASLPLWKKPFAYALRLLQFIGGVVAWLSVFSLSFSGLVLGIAVTVLSELIFQLLKGKPYAWQTS